MLSLGRTAINTASEIFESGREKVGELLSENYYITKRAVLHGFPWAIVSSVAMGYIFNSTNLFASAVYGAVNYSVVTLLIELHGPLRNEGRSNSYISGGLILGAGYAIGTAFVQTVLKTNLTYLMAVPLAAGAFMGQIARQLAWDEID